MHMSFFWTAHLGDYLFPGLHVQNVGALIAICVVVGAMAFFFEFMRYLQTKHKQTELQLRSQQIKSICPTDSVTLLTPSRIGIDPLNITRLDRIKLFAIELGLWLGLQNIGYFLMLSIMLYNGWIFISALIGGGLGYFVFGQMFMKINLQNCQTIRDTFCMQSCGESETVPSTRDGESTPALATPSTSQGLLPCHSEITASVHAECDR